jgi:RNA polymerase sigma-70 factor (ECF subfamily)
VLFSIALLRLLNVEDAEDAVQDAFLSAYKNIGQFEGRSQLSSWLTRIVINAAGMKLRSRPRQEIVSLDRAPVDGEATLANELVDARPNPETICAQTEMEETLRSALDRVSPKLRVAFQLREIAGYSTREAAQALGVTTNTLKSRVSRARVAIGLHVRKVEAAKPADEWKAPMMNRTANACQRSDVRLAAD